MEVGELQEMRKQAYRYLLYQAMLDIRPLSWIGGRWRERLNPCWWRGAWRQVRVAGAIAEWLHNLAIYSALDFVRFDEDRFWQDYRWMLGQIPGAGLERYREEFDRRVNPVEPQNMSAN